MKLDEITYISDRQEFVNCWLVEAPMKIGAIETFSSLKYAIKELKEAGIAVNNIDDDTFISKSTDMVWAWVEKENVPVLIVEFKLTNQNLTVKAVGKNPNLRGQSPFTSDLYLRVTKYADKSIRLTSDEDLSDEGFSIWKKLVSLGIKISVYNIDNPGQTYQKIDSIDDLDKYVGTDRSFKRYQFVISEDVKSRFYVLAQFNRRKNREDNNIL